MKSYSHENTNKMQQKAYSDKLLYLFRREVKKDASVCCCYKLIKEPPTINEKTASKVEAVSAIELLTLLRDFVTPYAGSKTVSIT